MDQSKIEQLKALGLDEALLSSLLGAVEHKDATAQAAGLAFKSDEAEADPPAVLWTPEEAAELAQAMTPHLVPAIAQALATQQQALTEQTVKAFKELVGVMGQALRQKDDALATANQKVEAQGKQLAALDTRLKSLEGDQPKAFYRASQDPATAHGVEALKELGTPQPDNADPFAEIYAGLGLNGLLGQQR